MGVAGYCLAQGLCAPPATPQVELLNYAMLHGECGCPTYGPDTQYILALLMPGRTLNLCVKKWELIFF